MCEAIIHSTAESVLCDKITVSKKVIMLHCYWSIDFHTNNFVTEKQHNDFVTYVVSVEVILLTYCLWVIIILITC